MNYYKAILRQAYPVSVTPSETSYFSELSKGLDPTLFHGDHIIPSVRDAILSSLFSALSLKFNNAESWCHVWLAGSGVSFHWAAHRDPADLDCLLGIDYHKFKQANKNYEWFSNREIADEVNEYLSENLHPQTENFLGHFDLTFYANVKSNIVDIKPYAAYSLTDDKWVVEPTKTPVQRRPEWDQVVRGDIEKAYQITDRYRKHQLDMKNAPNDAARRNAEVALVNSIEQGSALYSEIHGNRKLAFSPSGEGYEDFNNYRWQAGKESGIVQSLKTLHQTAKSLRGAPISGNDVVEFPDTSTLIRRAALQGAKYVR